MKINCKIFLICILTLSQLLYSEKLSATEPIVADNVADVRVLISQLDVERELNLVDTLISVLTMGEQSLQFVTSEDEYGNPLEIYDDMWDNDMVHPYKNASIPDSILIDCSKFAFPTFGHVTSQFGPRRRRMHNGIDLKVYKGDTIASAFDGKVRVAKYMRGYGNVVVLRHSNGLETIYGHLSKIKVKIDQDVKVGECIGLGGSTGRSTGTHLHFEARLMGRPINPSEIFDFDNNVLRTEKYMFYAKKSPYRDPRYKNIAYHKVQRGESLSAISSRYKVSVSELCRINRLSKKSVLRPGQVIRLENAAPASQAPQRSKEQLANSISNAKSQQNRRTEQAAVIPTPTGGRHTIRRGETLGAIARKHGLTVEQLCSYNGITPNTVIREGKTLQIASTQRTPEQSLTAKLDRSIKETSTLITKKSTETKSPNSQVVHKVRSGDTLGKIAAKYGVTVERLCSINGISKQSMLQLGQLIRCS